MKQTKQCYSFIGPVELFGRCIANKWAGTTFAVSKSKARSNLSYQFKREFGYEYNVPIKLIGDIVLYESEETHNTAV